MEEVWKDIPDYEGLYQVSNLGRVKSLRRKVSFVNRWGQDAQRTVPEKIRAATVHPNRGHLFVILHKEGKRRKWHVHTLVLTAFVGPCPEGMQCLHGDGDPKNNRVENLRWGTPSENSLDSVRHGTHWCARKTHCKHGHEFSPENTHIRPDGSRLCRTCMKLRQRKRSQRNFSK